VPSKSNALGDYLRARRQQVRPEDVGLVPGARRRVEGLRREELAMLAGISAEYYLRLEVGRDKNPSPQVVEALARALQLDIKATRYLHQLANPTISRWDHSVLDAVVEGLDQLAQRAEIRHLANWLLRNTTSAKSTSIRSTKHFA
jgi:transcriptional regulator with XRE-family HTH domain